MWGNTLWLIYATISTSAPLLGCVCLPLVGIKELEKEKLSLQSDSGSYSDQVSKLSSGLMQHFVTLSVYFHLLLEFTPLQFYLLGSQIATEAPYYDRNVPGEWAEAAQV